MEHKTKCNVGLVVSLLIEYNDYWQIKLVTIEWIKIMSVLTMLKRKCGVLGAEGDKGSVFLKLFLSVKTENVFFFI